MVGSQHLSSVFICLFTRKLHGALLPFYFWKRERQSRKTVCLSPSLLSLLFFWGSENLSIFFSPPQTDKCVLDVSLILLVFSFPEMLWGPEGGTDTCQSNGSIVIPRLFFLLSYLWTVLCKIPPNFPLAPCFINSGPPAFLNCMNSFLETWT